LEIFLQLKKEWIKDSKELYNLLKEEEENEFN
ncbi:PadR family transcriptional regulator, partial [Bacillus cereus]